MREKRKKHGRLRVTTKNTQSKKKKEEKNKHDKSEIIYNSTLISEKFNLPKKSNYSYLGTNPVLLKKHKKDSLERNHTKQIVQKKKKKKKKNEISFCPDRAYPPNETNKQTNLEGGVYPMLLTDSSFFLFSISHFVYNLLNYIHKHQQHDCSYHNGIFISWNPSTK